MHELLGEYVKGKVKATLKLAEVNDPSDPLYLMKSNYYRNNFVQELDEVKTYGFHPGLVVFSQLINQLPVQNFH